MFDRSPNTSLKYSFRVNNKDNKPTYRDINNKKSLSLVSLLVTLNIYEPYESYHRKITITFHDLVSEVFRSKMVKCWGNKRFVFSSNKLQVSLIDIWTNTYNQ